MKNILLFIVCWFTFLTTTHAQTTAIPDTIFEQKLIQLGIDSDGLVNGQILNSDAAGVTYLDVHNSNISDLMGISAFSNLDTLICYNNNLTNLDVSGNIALKHLICSGNNLTNLNVLGNAALKYLYCNQNNLTSLDVSGNTVLEHLICKNNALTSLTVLGNVALKTLICDHNSLTNLSVSGNTTLRFLDCSNNVLPNLTVLGCVALETLACNGNNLTNLDVSGNTALKFLNCSDNALTNLTVLGAMALEMLTCNNNNLTNLDVSGNTVLKQVIGDNNNLTSLTVLGAVALEILTCNSNNLTNLDVSGNTVLKSLSCNYNALTSLTVSGNLALETLACNGNNLTNLDVSGNTVLKSLACNNNNLTSLTVLGAVALETLTCNNNSLTNLDVSGNTVLKSLTCNYSTLTSLTVLGAVALEMLACNNNNLTNLDVSGNTVLEYLSCNNNSLIGLNISGNIALERLSCYNNDLVILDVSGGAALKYLTCSRNKLTTLDVSRNGLLVQLQCTFNIPYLQICVQDIITTTSPSWTKDASAIYTEGCYPLAIEGRVVIDTNNNCLADSLENGLIGQFVKFEKTTDTTTAYFLTYDSLGNYKAYLDTGVYTVSVIPSNPYWQACPSSQQVTIDTNYILQIVNWSLQPFVACPLLEVDISAPFLRMTGGGSAYTVSYCNNGTAAAPNVSIEVDLDPSLNFVSATIPVANQNGTVYTFNLGAVGVGACGNFDIQVLVDTSAQFQQTHCTEVHIYPDSICLPIWSGPIVDGDVNCQNDSVLFFIENIGTGMLQPQSYTVIQDDIAMRTGFIQLPAGQSTTIIEPALEGKTYRIEVEQAVGYPSLLGDPIFSKAIEGCNPYPDGSFNTGFITQFSNGYSSPFQAIDCQQNIASYDPNDKAAQPEGYGMAHYIEQNIPIDYKVRFQNTGTDTAFNIVIVDTLSPYVEVSSLQMGASSHQHTWEIIDGNVLKVTFSDILLVDSNANEPLSHGFFRYRINQALNNPLGSVIENQAAIYFDYNPPIFTNTTFHTVGENFVPLVLSVDHIYVDNIKVTAYPNPFQVSTIIKVEGDSYKELELSVFDISGRLVRQKKASFSNQVEFSKGNLQTGVYIYQLKGDQQLLNTGKIIAQ